MAEQSDGRFDEPLNVADSKQDLDIQFRSLDDVEAFLAAEESAWSWLKDAARLEVKNMEGMRQFAEKNQFDGVDGPLTASACQNGGRRRSPETGAIHERDYNDWAGSGQARVSGSRGR